MVLFRENPGGAGMEDGHAGRASLEVSRVSGASVVTSAYSTAPMRLLTPRSRGRSVWACLSSFGGGLLAGDRTRLDVTLGPETRCVLGTQASTKIYRNPDSLPSGHATRAVIGENAVLVFAPDPVQPFTDSVYSQRQRFDLSPGAGLVLVDSFGSGRAACGERWAFRRFETRNEIHAGGALLMRDALMLDPADGALGASHRMGRFEMFSMIAILGSPFREHAAALLAEVSEGAVGRRRPLLCAASPVGDGVLVRLAGERHEDVAAEIRRLLAFVPPILGEDPWERKR